MLVQDLKEKKTLRTPLIEGRMEMAERFSKEYGFAYYFIESNIHQYCVKLTFNRL